MFARSEFSSPQKTPPPTENRALGAIVLLTCIVILVFLVISADASLFTPYNATRAVTQTWQARQTPQATRTPRATSTPRFGNPGDKIAQAKDGQ